MLITVLTTEKTRSEQNTYNTTDREEGEPVLIITARQ